MSDSIADSGSSSSAPAIDPAVQRAQREVQALLAWSCTFLGKRQLAAHSLYSFDDGVLLINLLEIAFNDTLPKYHNRPKLPIHKMENISIAFDHMQKMGITLLSIDPNDLVSHKDKQIISVLWNILRGHLLGAMRAGDKEKSAKAQNIKDRLMQWCSETFANEPNIRINDFWESFKSGIALSAIVNKLHPGAIDMSSLKPENAQENLARAIKAAELFLGIPALLDPEDFNSSISDEASVVNYLSMLLSASYTTAKAKEAQERLAAEKLARENEAKREKEKLEELHKQVVERQESELKERGEEISRLNELLEKKQAELSEMRVSLQTSQAQRQSVEEALQYEQKKVAHAEMKIVEQEKLMSGEMKNAVEAEKRIISAMEGELAEVNSTLQAAREKARQEANEFAAERAKLESNIRELEGKIRELQDAKEAKEMENLTLREELATAKSQNNSLEAKLAEEKEKNTETVSALNAQVYALHKEIEELVNRVRTEEKAAVQLSNQAEAKKYSDIARLRDEAVRKQHAMREMMSATFTKESLDAMKAHGGYLMRRRPLALFHSKRYKQVYFRLRGEFLEWGKDEAHIKNSLKIRDYAPGVVKSTLSGQFMFELTPKSAGSDKGNLVFDFMSLPEESDPSDRVIKAWLYQINRRIAFCQHLASATDKKPAIPEFVQFICNDKLQILSCHDVVQGVPEALATFNPALQYRTNLKKLELCNVNLTDAHMSFIAELLKENKSLQQLDLSNNLISEVGAQAIASVLALQNQTLKVLILDNNQLKDEGSRRLTTILPSHPLLMDISLNGNQLSDFSVNSLCSDLLASEKKNGSPHLFPEIHLRGNKISDRGCEALALLVKRNYTIRSIDLENNAVGDVGAIALINILSDPAVVSAPEKVRSQLSSVNFAGNQLSSKALIQFAEVMKSTSNELALDLSSNKLISRPGLRAIVGIDAQMDYPMLKLVKRGERELEEIKSDLDMASAGPTRENSLVRAASSKPAAAARAGGESPSDTPQGSRANSDDESD